MQRIKFIVLGLLLAAAQSQAAIYTGSWDPTFGGAYPNLGWRGTATYNIPDACLAQPNGNVANGAPCSGGTMTVLSAFVELYDTAVPAVTVETLAFGTSLAVNSIDVVANALDGVFTGYSSLQFSTYAGVYFSLTFLGDQADLVYLNSSGDDPNAAPQSQHSATQPQVTFTPEPGTWALAGLALAGLASTRRLGRRRSGGR